MPRTPDQILCPSLETIEHAYALTNYGMQGNTIDRAYVLLDGETSLEQGLVAISRGREVASVYAVASSELLGPDRREIGDALQDVRAAIEREGKRLRDRRAGPASGDRADVRPRAGRAPHRSGSAGDAATPLPDARERRMRVIERGRVWRAALGREREALEAMLEPPRSELGRVTAAE